MVLNAPDDNETELRSYYNANSGYDGSCTQNYKAKWWRFTPYDWQETKYYIIKMVALPIVAAVIFIIIFQVGLGSFNNPIIQLISTILFYIASFFFTSYSREVIRAEINEITVADGLIDEEQDPNNLIDATAPPFTIHLNKISPPLFEIGFVGDMMMMRDHNLEFDNDIIDFFDGVKIIAGNLEGIVRIGGSTLTTQAHIPDIFTQLPRLLRNTTEWLLCLSNNHSIDFGSKEFIDSLNLIRDKPKIYVFGRHDVPNAINQSININTATKWSNQKNWDCISRYEDIDDSNGIRAHHLSDRFNILYPHWGYENERYVRKSIQSDARALLSGQLQNYPRDLQGDITADPTHKWDLIFGHHSHVRQPIMMVDDVTANNKPYKKLVIFSGGNFTSGVRFFRARKHLYGTIMRCKIGRLREDPTQIAIGDVRWQRTVNVRTTPGGAKTKTVTIDTGDYPSSNTNSLIIAIVIIASIILVRILELFFN